MPEHVGLSVAPPAPLSSVAWGQNLLPPAHDCWTWELGTMRDVTRVRSAVRRRLGDEPGTSPPREEAAERMILALDELASNGLRHGRQPVGLRVCPLPEHWLVDVTDADPAVPPPRTRVARRAGAATGCS